LVEIVYGGIKKKEILIEKRVKKKRIRREVIS